MLQTLKKRRAEGFTLVELLIVIVVIAILAAIVITTFSGVQARARDTERQTDIKSISSQLEVYYTDEGTYPLDSQMEAVDGSVTGSISGVAYSPLLRGLSPDALVNPQAPDGTVNSFAGTGGVAANNYRYTALEADGTTACTTAPCEKFSIQYIKEEGNETVTVNSLN